MDNMDNKSTIGAVSTFFLASIADISRSGVLFFLSATVALTTIVYNLIKISENFKKK